MNGQSAAPHRNNCEIMHRIIVTLEGYRIIIMCFHESGKLPFHCVPAECTIFFSLVLDVLRGEAHVPLDLESGIGEISRHVPVELTGSS